MRNFTYLITLILAGVCFFAISGNIYAQEIITDGRNSFNEAEFEFQGGAYLSAGNHRIYKGYATTNSAVQIGISLASGDFGISTEASYSEDYSDNLSFIGYHHSDGEVFRIGISNFSSNQDATNDEIQDRSEAVVALGYESKNLMFLIDYRKNLTNADEVGDYYTLFSSIMLYVVKIDLDLSFEAGFSNHPQRSSESHHQDLKLQLSYPLQNKSLQLILGKIQYASVDSKEKANEETKDGFNYGSIQMVFGF
jgi:hypothetical protein